MRIQDVLKFSLELVLPERLVRALQSRGRANAAQPSPSIADDGNVELSRARSIIEDLDHVEFGGPSFGSQTMQLMAQVLDEIRTELPDPVSDHELRRIAAAILKAAADGERDLARLKSRARVAFSGDNPADKA